MIINRITFHVKWGTDGKLMQAHIDEIKRFASPLLKSWRVCNSAYGTMSRVILDLEFVDVAACEQFWAAWWATPGANEFMTTSGANIESGSYSEVLNIIGQG